MQEYIEQLWETVTIEFMFKFFVVYFFVVWMALVLWVAKDISNRSNSRIFQTFCVLLIILLTPLGVFLYLLLRPRMSVYEKYQEEIEGNLLILWDIVHERLEKAPGEMLLCHNCHIKVEDDYIMCPECKTSLKHNCKSCRKEIRSSWAVCPYCKTKQEKKTHQKKSQKHKAKKQKNSNY